MESDSIPLVTLVFGDIEESTRCHQTFGLPFMQAEREMHRIARTAAERQGGHYVKNTGDGFLLDFAAPMAAIRCACEIQKCLAGDSWDSQIPRPAVRIGIHTDEQSMLDGEYVFPLSWRAHRVMDAAHGGQILLSNACHALAALHLVEEPGIHCESLGTYRLRDLLEPEKLYRVHIDGLNLPTRPPRALPEARHNLPIEKRPFVGREKEVADLCALLRNPSVRLVTLTGTGGIGKTRLARHAGAQVVDAFEDGMWQVECDAVDGEQPLLAAIYAALNLPPAAADPERGLHEAVVEKELLLLLDCFEKIVALAPIIDRLITAAPRIRCLVTSRKVLRLERETVYRLAPMPLGGKSGRTSGDSMTLFENSARFVDPGFTLNARNRKVAADICEALEGIPLSVLLAAGWLRYMSLEELLAEIKNRRANILAEGVVDNERHRDMARVVSGSFLLLTEEERRRLRQLSVFSGGFTMDAAATICDTSEPRGRHLIRAHIARLVDNSLLYAVDDNGTTRYKILDTIREYLAESDAEELAEADVDGCRARHAAYFTNLAATASVRVREGGWEQGTGVLRREIPNFRAAIAYHIERTDHENIVGITDSLALHCFEAGLWEDFDRLVQAGAESARLLNRQDILARLLGLAGAHARRRGDEEHGRDSWRERLALCRALRDHDAALDTLLDLANQALDISQRTRDRSELQIARNYAGQALTLARRRKQPIPVALARTLQARIAVHEGDSIAGELYAAEARDLIERVGAQGDVVTIAGHLGAVFHHLGDYNSAESLLRKSLQLALEGEHTFSAGWALLELAAVYQATFHMQTAAFCLLAASKIHAHIPGRLHNEASNALTKFEAAHGALQINEWLGESVDEPWRTIATVRILGEDVSHPASTR